MIKKLIFLSSLIFTTQIMGHHSFAIYDFATRVPFDGVVDTIKFRNPHIEMTLKIINTEGQEEIIHGAPANMMVRSGVRPAMMSPGTKLHAIGSPLIEDPTKYFLRSIRTEDGKEYAN